MNQTLSVDSAWISTELMKGMNAERSMAADSQSRATAPPNPTLSVLYHEIADADERHATIIETIATRYGHTPMRSASSGIGQVLGNLKAKVGELGSSPLDLLSWDLTAKAQSVHWLTAWAHTFSAIGDAESAGEISAVLAEEQKHCEALQQAFDQSVEQHARAGDDVKNG